MAGVARPSETCSRPIRGSPGTGQEADEACIRPTIHVSLIRRGRCGPLYEVAAGRAARRRGAGDWQVPGDVARPRRCRGSCRASRGGIFQASQGAERFSSGRSGSRTFSMGGILGGPFGDGRCGFQHEHTYFRETSLSCPRPCHCHTQDIASTFTSLAHRRIVRLTGCVTSLRHSQRLRTAGVPLLRLCIQSDPQAEK